MAVASNNKTMQFFEKRHNPRCSRPKNDVNHAMKGGPFHEIEQGKSVTPSIDHSPAIQRREGRGKAADGGIGMGNNELNQPGLRYGPVKPSFRGEFLDALVVGIDDEQFARGVDGDAVRGGEFAWFGALARLDAAEEFAVGVELLNAAVDRCDPDMVVGVDRDADRAFEVDALSLIGELAAEIAGFVFRLPHISIGLPSLGQFLHAADQAFGRVEFPFSIEGQKLRAADAGFRVRGAAELSGSGAVFAELREEFSLLVEDLHAAIGLIGDVDVVIRTDGDAAGKISSPSPFPVLPNSRTNFPVGIVDGDPILIFLLAAAARREMRNVERAVLVRGDATRIRQDGNRREMLASKSNFCTRLL